MAFKKNKTLIVEALKLQKLGSFYEAAQQYEEILKDTSLEKKEQWEAQFQLAQCHAQDKAPIYAERSDEIGDQITDIRAHCEKVMASFEKAIALTPGLEEKRKTIETAISFAKELREFYSSQTKGWAFYGTDVGKMCYDRFSELIEYFSSL